MVSLFLPYPKIVFKCNNCFKLFKILIKLLYANRKLCTPIHFFNDKLPIEATNNHWLSIYKYKLLLRKKINRKFIHFKVAVTTKLENCIKIIWNTRRSFSAKHQKVHSKHVCVCVNEEIIAACGIRVNCVNVLVRWRGISKWRPFLTWRLKGESFTRVPSVESCVIIFWRVAWRLSIYYRLEVVQL